jgi:glycosyltransferase involved in cell wall biosynthesis
MKISVVTISYNQREFLKACMDSVLTQNGNFEVEYIVVDPGSTDGSRDLINSYGDAVVKVFEKDAGPADGLNKGFLLATGDVYCFLNSDDVFAPFALANVARLFSGKTNEKLVISGGARLIDHAGVELRKLYSDQFDLVASAYGECILIQPSTFFTRSSYLAVEGFNVNNRTNWDGELFIEMALAGCKFSVCSSILSDYRVHESSITGSMSTVNKMEDYKRYRYERIVNSPYEKRSLLMQYFYKYRRKLLNPRDTLQRLMFGRSFGRAVK